MGGLKNNVFFGDRIELGDTPATGSPEISAETQKDAADVKAQLINTSTTATAGSQLEIRTEGTTGNTFIQHSANGGAREFINGVDGAANTYHISPGTSFTGSFSMDSDGDLVLGGGLALKNERVTVGPLALDKSDYYLFVDAGITLNLPAAGISPGQTFRIINFDGGAEASPIVINAGGGQNINGQPSYSIGVDYGGVDLVWTNSGSRWLATAISEDLPIPLTVPYGGTGLTTIGANEVMIGNGISPVVTVGPGTVGQVLTSNGAGLNPSFQAAGAAGGKLVQQVRTNTKALVAFSAAIPADNSIPQNTEGTQVLSASITPTNVNNILKFETSLQVQNNVISRTITQALFQDAGINAIYASSNGNSTSSRQWEASFTWYMTAGTVASTTFDLRIGLSTANAGNLNNLYGGVSQSSMIITEIEV